MFGFVTPIFPRSHRYLADRAKYIVLYIMTVSAHIQLQQYIIIYYQPRSLNDIVIRYIFEPGEKHE